ncbi:hypothetical protein [Taklimakanibacter lacteus]|uniref:hypothetical protein n=1 Tax=Taklimakanibacter lacteus TaxID=2268456 RepID=UPI0013C4FB94
MRKSRDITQKGRIAAKSLAHRLTGFSLPFFGGAARPGMERDWRRSSASTVQSCFKQSESIPVGGTFARPGIAGIVRQHGQAVPKSGLPDAQGSRYSLGLNATISGRP